MIDIVCGKKLNYTLAQIAQFQFLFYTTTSQKNNPHKHLVDACGDKSIL